MRRWNILVTAVGAIVGYGIIDALRLSGMNVHIVGTDIFPDAVGQYLADDFVVARPAAAPDYPEYLRDIIEAKDIDLVFFGIEQEIDAVCAAWDRLSDIAGKLVVNPPEINALFRDKWTTRNWMLENGLDIYTIPSAITGGYEDFCGQFGRPFLLKPRRSRAGKGIVRIDNETDFNYYRYKMGYEFMTQKIVGTDDEEYTVGVFGLGDGSFCDQLILKRRLSQEGATAKAEVMIKQPAIENATYLITRACKPVGPTNYQFRLHSGVPQLLEVNPRVSSSTSIRAKFGYNEAAMSIQYYLEHRRPDPQCVRYGRALRYITDWIVRP